MMAWLVLHDLSTVSFLRTPHFLSSIFIVLIVAITWEVFEVWAGIPIEQDYLLDTVTDLALGLCGGVVGYALGERLSAL